MGASIDQFLRSGQLGPVTLGMLPSDAELVLGEPDARSQKLNPLLVKYGPLELTFVSSKPDPPRLAQMVLSFDRGSGSGHLPGPVSTAEWPVGSGTTTAEFARLLQMHGIEPSETIPGHEVILPSGVRVTFSGDRLQQMRVSRREHPLYATVKLFESELGIPPGFLQSLLTTGDDWTFILKVHALTEAALTRLLSVVVGGEQQQRSAAVPLIRGIELATEHRLLDPGRATFLRALNWIRNAFVHDVRSVSLRIEDFVRLLDPVDQTQLWRDLMRGYTLEPMINDSGRLIPTEEFAAMRPRFAVWISSMSALSLMYRTKSLDEAGREKLFSALAAMEPLRAAPSSRRSRRNDK